VTATDAQPHDADAEAGDRPTLTVLAPALNEVENVAGLLQDVDQAISPTGIDFEMLIVDDGSTDGTVEKLLDLRRGYPWLRIAKMQGPPRQGPSAVFRAGITEARGRIIGTIDADRQNDPTDLPAMIDAIESRGFDFVQGDRSANRRDNFIRRISSRTGRAFRRTILGDTIRDSACAIRVYRRDVALQIPLQFKGVHRFMAVYAKFLGYKVLEMPVNHRPRTAGTAKFGIWNRALPGLIDLIAVRWMRSRLRPGACRPVATDAATDAAEPVAEPAGERVS
jgi:dolichol-phosphate mannosyltransferase